MTERLPDEPEPGTVGVGVDDGAYGDISSADEIQRYIGEYLRRSGVPVTEMRLLGRGSVAGGFMESVVQNIWASLAILAASKFLAFIRNARDRKFEREQTEQLRPCFIHLDDKRAERSNVLEILRLLPDLHKQVDQEFPNRNYTFSVHSSLQRPKLRSIDVKLEKFDDLGLTTRGIMRKLTKLSDSQFVFVYLKDGPYHTRPYALDAV